MSLSPRTPVLVGVGTCDDDAEAAELMARATRRAADDGGAPDLLGRIQRIAVPRGTWSYRDPARYVAERIGAVDATTVLVDVGIPQQTLIDETLAALLAGDIDVGLVVGAEAKARAARARLASTRADAAGVIEAFQGADAAAASETDQGDARPDLFQQPTGELLDAAELAAGLFSPVEQYAMVESAVGAAAGLAPAEHRRQIAIAHARFNDVARSNPDAAFGEPMTAEQIATFGPHNRPVAFPYGKWHASQWTVDQGASLLFATVEAAEEMGVPPERWVFPLVALSSSHSCPLTQRRHIDRWPAMRVLGEAATARLGHAVGECDHLEVYSCFPVAVRIQQRELGLDLDRTPTITGGMAFAGGPFNNFVLQATAAMARQVRTHGGRGLVTTVSGMLTKPGIGVWADEPDDRLPLVDDLAPVADAATDRVPVRARPDGPATVVAYTVVYEAMEPREVVAVVDLADGSRAVARDADSDTIDRAVTDGLVGGAL